jgi:hypothetical protein
MLQVEGEISPFHANWASAWRVKIDVIHGPSDGRYFFEKSVDSIAAVSYYLA